jgi:hypothetical protein
MSIKIMSAVWESGPAGASETLLLLALADYCNDEGECWPSVAALARKARMTERGVQKIAARLCEAGLLEIELGGGRKNCNLYRIKNPERRSPRTPFTPNVETETPNVETKNPEPRSPEPLRTVKEPLVSDKTGAADALEAWASPHAVQSFLAYRRKHKAKALTLTGAKRLAGHLKEIFNGGGDVDDALAMAEEKGWASVEADWYFKAKGARNGNGHSGQGGARGGGMVDAFAAVAAARSGHA